MSFIRCRKSAFKSNFPWDLRLKKFALDHDLVPVIAQKDPDFNFSYWANWPFVII